MAHKSSIRKPLSTIIESRLGDKCSATIGFTNKSDYTPRRHSSHKFNCCRFFILFFETSSAEGK
nr:unnamed protein product [Callosobruchus analis]CAI5863302.1 unnamed protein product [Callosobruchus analis]